MVSERMDSKRDDSLVDVRGDYNYQDEGTEDCLCRELEI